MTGNASRRLSMVALRPLVKAALGGLEALAGDRLDCVGGAGHDRLGVVVRREIREHVVGERPWVAALGPAHADAQTEEVLPAELLRDRAEAVVPREPAAGARLEPSEVEIAFVVDDQELLGRDLEETDCRRDRATRRARIALRRQQPESKPTVANLGELTGELALEAAAVTACELVDGHPADVVAVLRVLATRVAETDDEQVERRGRVPALEDAHLPLGTA